MNEFGVVFHFGKLAEDDFALLLILDLCPVSDFCRSGRASDEFCVKFGTLEENFWKWLKSGLLRLYALSMNSTVVKTDAYLIFYC